MKMKLQGQCEGYTIHKGIRRANTGKEKERKARENNPPATGSRDKRAWPNKYKTGLGLPRDQSPTKEQKKDDIETRYARGVSRKTERGEIGPKKRKLGGEQKGDRVTTRAPAKKKKRNEGTVWEEKSGVVQGQGGNRARDSRPGT